MVDVKRGGLQQEQQSRDAKDLDLLKWLTPSEPLEAHLGIRESRLTDTRQWLLENPKFMAWLDDKQASNVVWCHRIPGAGKTVISSLVIDHLNDKFAGQDISTVFYYCDFGNLDTQSASKIIASLSK